MPRKCNPVKHVPTEAEAAALAQCRIDNGVYPIRVTGDQLSCTGKATCMTSHADNAEGTCFKTTFGDWQCYFSQTFNVTKSAVNLPAPTQY